MERASFTLSESAYPFVIIDALVIKVRRDEAVRSTSGLIISGINETAHRELLGLRLGDSESVDSGELHNALNHIQQAVWGALRAEIESLLKAK